MLTSTPRIKVNSVIQLNPLNNLSAPTLHKLYLDKENVKFMNDVIVTWVGDIDKAKNTIEIILSSHEDFVWEIKYRDNGVGIVGLENIDFKKKSAELWFVLEREHQEKGIMSQAVKSLIRYLKNEELSQLKAKVKIDNLASHNLLNRLGFNKIGTSSTDEIMYLLELN